jgi:hypothetical protein
LNQVEAGWSAVVATSISFYTSVHLATTFLDRVGVWWSAAIANSICHNINMAASRTAAEQRSLTWRVTAGPQVAIQAIQAVSSSVIALHFTELNTHFCDFNWLPSCQCLIVDDANVFDQTGQDR